jgi:alpha-beta hydrolase superfamily lysophospholipase
MYSNFILRELPKGIIQGYSWPLENPEKVICIVHGIGEYGGRFDRVAEFFRAAGFAVISLDLRGHGNSVEKKGHCAPRKAVLEDITALLEYARKQYPGKEIVLYGHSMGGNIVLDYRNRGYENDLPVAYIISSPWIRLVRSIPTSMYMFVKTASKVMPKFVISSSVSEKKLGNLETVKPYHENPMVHNSISTLCAVNGYEVGLGLEDGTLEDNGRARKIPTLLMHGDLDKICAIEGSRKLAARLEKQGDDIKYIEWPGFFHELHNGNDVTKGEEVINTMIEWIKAL